MGSFLLLLSGLSHPPPPGKEVGFGFSSTFWFYQAQGFAVMMKGAFSAGCLHSIALDMLQGKIKRSGKPSLKTMRARIQSLQLLSDSLRPHGL